MNRVDDVMRVAQVSFARCLLALMLLAPGLAVTGANADEVTFDLRIERGRVPADMRLIRARQGDTLTLRWRSDRPTVLHLHGYDIEREVEPGAVAEMSFTAHATGRFPVEVHAPGRGGGHAHEAPIVQIEIYPR